MAELFLTGKQKAAILLSFIGPEHTAEILRLLPEKVTEKIVSELAKVNRLKKETLDEVLKEAYHTLTEGEELVFVGGGARDVRELLLKSLGETRGKELFKKIARDVDERPFEFLRDIDPYPLSEILKREHPQTIALILAHSPSEHVAQILEMFPNDLRVEVVSRIASIDRVPAEVIEGLKRALEEKLFSLPEEIRAGGPRIAAELLTRVSRDTEKSIFEILDEKEPRIAEEIKRHMMSFESLTLLSDKDLQRVLMEIDVKDLPLALKGASKRVSEKIMNNLPQQRREIVEDELALMGPVRITDVDQAQQRILSKVRELEDKGEIVIVREGEVIV